MHLWGSGGVQKWSCSFSCFSMSPYWAIWTLFRQSSMISLKLKILKAIYIYIYICIYYELPNLRENDSHSSGDYFSESWLPGINLENRIDEIFWGTFKGGLTFLKDLLGLLQQGFQVFGPTGTFATQISGFDLLGPSRNRFHEIGYFDIPSLVACWLVARQQVLVSKRLDAKKHYDISAKVLDGTGVWPVGHGCAVLCWGTGGGDLSHVIVILDTREPCGSGLIFVWVWI